LFLLTKAFAYGRIAVWLGLRLSIEKLAKDASGKYLV